MPRTKHGESARGGSTKKTTPEYRAWIQMKSRCHCETHHKYPEYGAKGVTVCRRWRNSFEAFLADMGRKPSSQHTLDRRDGTKGYSPANCRWATKSEQNRNKKTNRMLTIDGVTKCVAAWAEDAGTYIALIVARLNAGWSPRRAVFTPARVYGKKNGEKT